ncbi:MAG: redox-regulated ATPase YchF, partial [Myxococcales bacterium]|nr:redox-regulated ATPase YchF [Myxococcales bacterium]
EILSKHLDEGKPARTATLPDSVDAKAVVREMHLLTAKPAFYIANIDETSIGALEKNKHFMALSKLAESEGTFVVPVCAALESQIAELDPAERPDFLASAGLKEPGLHAVVRAGYKLLGLLTFFTVGKVEVRAWTTKIGARAPQAAGEIHTDIEKSFIKAEVIWWEDLIALGSEAKCREAGKMAIEGKDYVMRDGDVVHFRHNG